MILMVLLFLILVGIVGASILIGVYWLTVKMLASARRGQRIVATVVGAITAVIAIYLRFDWIHVGLDRSASSGGWSYVGALITPTWVELGMLCLSLLALMASYLLLRQIRARHDALGRYSHANPMALPMIQSMFVGVFAGLFGALAAIWPVAIMLIANPGLEHRLGLG